MLQAALFDIDGTLVDSNDAHTRAWIDAFAERGRAVEYDRIRPLIGMGSDKLLATLGEQLGEPAAFTGEAGKQLAQRRKAIFIERYLDTVKPFPGARELVGSLKAHGVRCIVASSASPEELGPLLGIAGVPDTFDHAVKPDDVEGSKPDGDTVAAALQWARVPAEDAVMIGDTEYDIEAAHRSHVRCIALACGGSSSERLSQADALFADPSALLIAWHRGALPTELREFALSNG